MKPAVGHDTATVAVYARYSTDRQDSRSIDDQVRRCRGFADSRGLKVIDVYKDAAESGAHLERTDLQRLLTEARSARCRFLFTVPAGAAAARRRHAPRGPTPARGAA